ncbi:hypothetical protein LTR08_000530 [Meristemomyces frigidus]|nr:hypothetical protein LTR08_000530 [Meristemomyces frigidus]
MTFDTNIDTRREGMTTIAFDPDPIDGQAMADLYHALPPLPRVMRPPVRITLTLGGHLVKLAIGVVALAGLLIVTAYLLRFCLEETLPTPPPLPETQRDQNKNVQTHPTNPEQIRLQTGTAQASRAPVEDVRAPVEDVRAPVEDVRAPPVESKKVQSPERTVEQPAEEARPQSTKPGESLDGALSQPANSSKYEVLEAIKKRERDMEARFAANDIRSSPQESRPDWSPAASHHEDERSSNTELELAQEAAAFITNQQDDARDRSIPPHPSQAETTVVATDKQDDILDGRDRRPSVEEVQPQRGPPPAVYRPHKKIDATSYKPTVSKEEKKAQAQAQWLSSMGSNSSSPPARQTGPPPSEPVSRPPALKTPTRPTEQAARPGVYSAEQLAEAASFMKAASQGQPKRRPVIAAATFKPRRVDPAPKPAPDSKQIAPANNFSGSVPSSQLPPHLRKAKPVQEGWKENQAVTWITEVPEFCDDEAPTPQDTQKLKTKGKPEDEQKTQNAMNDRVQREHEDPPPGTANGGSKQPIIEPQTNGDANHGASREIQSNPEIGQSPAPILLEHTAADPVSELEPKIETTRPTTQKPRTVYEIDTLKSLLAQTASTTNPRIDRAQRVISPTPAGRSSALKDVVKVANKQAQRNRNALVDAASLKNQAFATMASAPGIDGHYPDVSDIHKPVVDLPGEKDRAESKSLFDHDPSVNGALFPEAFQEPGVVESAERTAAHESPDSELIQQASLANNSIVDLTHGNGGVDLEAASLDPPESEHVDASFSDGNLLDLDFSSPSASKRVTQSKRRRDSSLAPTAPSFFAPSPSVSSVVRHATDDSAAAARDHALLPYWQPQPLYSHAHQAFPQPPQPYPQPFQPLQAAQFTTEPTYEYQQLMPLPWQAQYPEAHVNNQFTKSPAPSKAISITKPPPSLTPPARKEKIKVSLLPSSRRAIPIGTPPPGLDVPQSNSQATLDSILLDGDEEFQTRRSLPGSPDNEASEVEAHAVRNSQSNRGNGKGNDTTAEESSDHDTRPNSSAGSLHGSSSDKETLHQSLALPPKTSSNFESAQLINIGHDGRSGDSDAAVKAGSEHEDAAGGQLQINGHKTVDQSTEQPANFSTTSADDSTAEDDGRPLTAKRVLKQKKDAAREALRAAWFARETARKKVKGTFSLDSIEALGAATAFYYSKRTELQHCMPGGALNAQDAEHFPEFPKNDLAAPKHRPTGAEQAYRERKAAEEVSEAPEVTDEPAAVSSKQDELRKALEIAFDLYDQAIAILERGPPAAGKRMADFAAAKAKLTRARAYYVRTRNKLEDGFPQDPWLMEKYVADPW